MKEETATPNANSAASRSRVTPTTDKPNPIAGLAIGRIVHYVLDKPYSAGEAAVIRPAMVVHVWDRMTGCSNLQVFIDGANDNYPPEQGTVWKTSRLYSAKHEPGTWHFPPRA